MCVCGNLRLRPGVCGPYGSGAAQASPTGSIQNCYRPVLPPFYCYTAVSSQARYLVVLVSGSLATSAKRSATAICTSQLFVVLQSRNAIGQALRESFRLGFSGARMPHCNENAAPSSTATFLRLAHISISSDLCPPVVLLPFSASRAYSV